MQIYNVGPNDLDFTPDYCNEISQDSLDKYEWSVYWYEAGEYEGNGEIVTLGKDGLLYTSGLGHCSCYGPLDGFGTCPGKGITVEEFLQPTSVLEPVYKDEIVAKVRELLQK
jgi:hypothetical protein